MSPRSLRHITTTYYFVVAVVATAIVWTSTHRGLEVVMDTHVLSLTPNDILGRLEVAAEVAREQWHRWPALRYSGDELAARAPALHAALDAADRDAAQAGAAWAAGEREWSTFDAAMGAAEQLCAEADRCLRRSRCE